MGREEERFQRRLSPSPWGTRQSGGGDIALPWNPLVLMGEAGRDKVPDPSSFCCCSVNKLNLTLCDPTDCSTPASLSFTISRSWLKLMSIESVMPSSHLVLCRPLLLLPSTFLAKQCTKICKGTPRTIRPWAPENPRMEDVWVGRGKSPRWGARGMPNPRGRAEQGAAVGGRRTWRLSGETQPWDV